MTLTVLTVTAATGCTAGQGDGWSALGPLSAQVGAVVTLTAVGDLLVAGRSTAAGEPAVEVLALSLIHISFRCVGCGAYPGR